MTYDQYNFYYTSNAIAECNIMNRQKVNALYTHYSHRLTYILLHAIPGQGVSQSRCYSKQ